MDRMQAVAAGALHVAIAQLVQVALGRGSRGRDPNFLVAAREALSRVIAALPEDEGTAEKAKAPTAVATPGAIVTAAEVWETARRLEGIGYLAAAATTLESGEIEKALLLRARKELTLQLWAAQVADGKATGVADALATEAAPGAAAIAVG